MKDEQTINGLPKGWRHVTFNDVCNKIGDIDHKMPKNIDSGYPYVSTKDFTDDLKISFEKAKFISREDFLLLSRKIKPERGDIIFPRYGTIGKNILIDFDKEFLVSYSCAIVKPNTNLVIPKYIYLYSLSPLVAKEIEKYVVETTQANIGIASIKRFVFPLAPLDVQQQIVTKIEELFSELDKGIEELKTAQQQIKVYRQAVLKWAFEGIQEEKPLEEVTDDYLIGIVRASGQQNSIRLGKPYIKMNNINLDGKVDFDNVVHVEINEAEAAKYSLSKGDILINTRNSIELVGKSGIVRAETPNAVFNNNLLRIRTKKQFDPFFISYQLISPNLLQQMRKGKKSTTNVCALYQRDIFPLRIKVVELDKQQQIIQKIESRLSVCDKIEETITASLKQADVLRQSILKKAFEGKLTDN